MKNEEADGQAQRLGVNRAARYFLTDDGHWPAVAIRIARFAFRTAADGHVIGYVADGVGAADAGTRIDAPIDQAALVARTIGTNDALGPAGDVRVSAVVGRTDASGRSADRIHLTLSVTPARSRLTRPRWLDHIRFDWTGEIIKFK